MVVITVPYCGSNLMHLPTTKLSCKTTCAVCIAGCHKKLCFGSKQASLMGLQSKPRKLELRAGGGQGFEGSDDEDENNENGGEAEENVSFWERQDTRQKMKELEDMSELVKEAEKLQEESDKAEAEEEEAAKEKEFEEEKRKMLREELAKRAKEQAEKRKAAEVMFQMGQRAYGKGMYNKAVELLEGALSNVTGVSLVGGEIQLWLAMAYEAHNRHDDCIALYKILEKTHPIRAIRQKAADLRYILEAPKLKITKDEMVSIPLIDYDLNYSSSNSKRSWSQMYRRRRKATGTKQPSPSKDYFQDFLVWKRPKWERSPLFWVAVAVWLTLVGVALVFQD